MWMTNGWIVGCMERRMCGWLDGRLGGQADKINEQVLPVGERVKSKNTLGSL